MKRLFLLLVPVICFGVYDIKWFDLNHWRCAFINDGRWGFDPTSGSGVPGASWPHPLKNFYLFGAGLWVGATVDSETLVTVGYNPNSAQTEFFPTLCRYWREGSADSLDRVYKYPDDWPPPISRFPMAPQSAVSEMDMWSCFGDSNPDCHNPPGRPLGIDIYLTVYGYSDSIAQDLFLLKYELANASGNHLNGLYFGVVVDADIGSSLDDMCGLILNKMFVVGGDTFWVKNAGFFYDYDNIEPPGSTWDSGTPGAVALRLLYAPNNLGLTAFKQFTIEIDPMTDPEQYLTLKGYNYQTGEYEPYDSIDPGPGDKRALFATGPFGLPPEAVLTFWYAVLAAPYGELGQMPDERDTTELVRRCWWAEQVWQRILGVKEVAEEPALGSVVFPNPCRIGTPLRIVLNKPVRIYDAQGRLVRNLTESGIKVWNGRDLWGRQVSAGVYFVKTGKDNQNTHKVLIVKE
ncbi:MAG: T9SS type A sorting domain-containing protein [candidate division WOR-3 bacterium]